MHSKISRIGPCRQCVSRSKNLGQQKRMKRKKPCELSSCLSLSCSTRDSTWLATWSCRFVSHCAQKALNTGPYTQYSIYIYMFTLSKPTCSPYPSLHVHPIQAYMFTLSKPTCSPYPSLHVHPIRAYMSTLSKPTCSPYPSLHVHPIQAYMSTLSKSTCSPY